MLYSRRSPISIAAAAIYMASQASDDKKSQKGMSSSIIMVNMRIFYMFLSKMGR